MRKESMDDRGLKTLINVSTTVAVAIYKRINETITFEDVNGFVILRRKDL